MEEDDFKQFEEDLFSPSVMITGVRDPDAVSQAVLDEEMSLFASFSRQNNALGG